MWFAGYAHPMPKGRNATIMQHFKSYPGAYLYTMRQHK